MDKTYFKIGKRGPVSVLFCLSFWFCTTSLTLFILTFLIDHIYFLVLLLRLVIFEKRITKYWEVTFCIPWRWGLSASCWSSPWRPSTWTPACSRTRPRSCQKACTKLSVFCSLVGPDLFCRIRIRTFLRIRTKLREPKLYLKEFIFKKKV